MQVLCRKHRTKVNTALYTKQDMTTNITHALYSTEKEESCMVSSDAQHGKIDLS